MLAACCLVIRLLSVFRPGSCSCNLRGWLTAEESHQAFQVLRRGCQVELLAHEAHPAQPHPAMSWDDERNRDFSPPGFLTAGRLDSQYATSPRPTPFQ